MNLYMSCKHAFSSSSSPQPPAKTMPVVKINRPASTKTKKEDYILLKDPIRNDCSI